MVTTPTNDDDLIKTADEWLQPNGPVPNNTSGEREYGDSENPELQGQLSVIKSLPRLRLTEWSPSEWYQDRASPTVKRLIHRHVAGKHTEHCITYDTNYYGWYCKWVDNVFWPRPYFTTALELAQRLSKPGSQAEGSQNANTLIAKLRREG